MKEKEVSSTPEVPKKGAPIHIVWEHHQDIQKRSTAQLDKIIGDNLRNNKSGNIVFFVEDGYIPLSWAEQIQQLVDSGYYPSYSFGMTQFAMEHQRLPDLDKSEEVEEMKALYNKNTPLKTKEMMAVADEHFAPDKRLRLLWEGIPDEAYEQKMQEMESLEKAIEGAHTQIAEGNFDQAVAFFKQMAEIRARSSRERDERLAERVATASEGEDVIAVVGAMGGNHIPFADLLVEKGHTVVRVEDANEEVSPRDEVINIRYHSPDEEISEVTWYRGMLGGAIEDYYAAIAGEEYQKTKTITTPTTIRQYAKWYLEKLVDMESIRLFEKQVRYQGFESALASLYDQ